MLFYGKQLSFVTSKLNSAKISLFFTRQFQKIKRVTPTFKVGYHTSHFSVLDIKTKTKKTGTKSV